MSTKPTEQATPRPWMYRPNPGSTKEDWSFHIDRQGTPNRANWGILIAACWGHVSESAEANAALIVKAVNAHDVSQRALAYMILLDCSKGAYWPEDLVDWARGLMHGEQRVGIQLVREATGITEPNQ